MRFHEIESERDAVQYIYEVYNPLGYLEFVVDEDRDWWEKAEHFAVAGFTFAAPLHFGSAISTGGYRANLPPMNVIEHMAAVRKFATEVYFYISRKAWSLARLGTSFVGRVAIASAPIAVAAGSAYAQTQVWDEIGDPMTGAVHYSGAGMMSGGSMPVIPSSGSPFLFTSPSWTLESWWDSLW